MNTSDWWNEAPEWARYLAMDKDGQWWWYECEPRARAVVDEWRPEEGRIKQAQEYHARWRETLEERPK